MNPTADLPLAHTHRFYSGLFTVFTSLSHYLTEQELDILRDALAPVREQYLLQFLTFNYKELLVCENFSIYHAHVWIFSLEYAHVWKFFSRVRTCAGEHAFPFICARPLHMSVLSSSRGVCSRGCLWLLFGVVPSPPNVVAVALAARLLCLVCRR